MKNSAISIPLYCNDLNHLLAFVSLGLFVGFRKKKKTFSEG